MVLKGENKESYMTKKLEIITSTIQITTHTLHVIPGDKECLVIAIEDDIPYTAYVHKDIIEKMLSRGADITEYILDSHTTVLAQVKSIKPKIRLTRLLIRITRDTDILFY